MLKATTREKERRCWVITRLFAVLFTLGAGSETQNFRKSMPQASMLAPDHLFAYLLYCQLRQRSALVSGMQTRRK